MSNSPMQTQHQFEVTEPALERQARSTTPLSIVVDSKGNPILTGDDLILLEKVIDQVHLKDYPQNNVEISKARLWACFFLSTFLIYLLELISGEAVSETSTRYFDSSLPFFAGSFIMILLLARIVAQRFFLRVILYKYSKWSIIAASLNIFLIIFSYSLISKIPSYNYYLGILFFCLYGWALFDLLKGIIKRKHYGRLGFFYLIGFSYMLYLNSFGPRSYDPRTNHAYTSHLHYPFFGTEKVELTTKDLLKKSAETNQEFEALLKKNSEEIKD